MINEIRTLARPAFCPCTERFNVSDCIPGDDLVMLDCEAVPPVLIHEDRSTNGAAVQIVPATSEDLQAVLTWLQSNPPHPVELTPPEMLSFLTADEEDAIQANARPLARKLFTAIVPIHYDVFAAAIEQIHSGGLITSERRDAILRCQVVD